MNPIQAYTFDTPKYLGKIPESFVPTKTELETIAWEPVKTEYSRDTVRSYNIQRYGMMDAIWKWVETAGASSISAFWTETRGEPVDSGLWWHSDDVNVLAVNLLGTIEWVFDPNFQPEGDARSDDMFSIILGPRDVLWSPMNIWHRVRALETPRMSLGVIFRETCDISIYDALEE